MGINFTQEEEDFRKSHLKKPDGQQPRKIDQKHVGGGDDHQQINQPPQGKVTDHIKKYDSENGSGAKPEQLDIVDKLLKSGQNSLASMLGMIGASNMNAIVATNNQQDGNHANNEPKCANGYFWNPAANNFQGNCQLNCPPGMMWDVNLQQCVANTSDVVYTPNNDANGLPVFIF